MSQTFWRFLSKWDSFFVFITPRSLFFVLFCCFKLLQYFVRSFFVTATASFSVSLHLQIDNPIYIYFIVLPLHCLLPECEIWCFKLISNIPFLSSRKFVCECLYIWFFVWRIIVPTRKAWKTNGKWIKQFVSSLIGCSKLRLFVKVTKKQRSDLFTIKFAWEFLNGEIGNWNAGWTIFHLTPARETEIILKKKKFYLEYLPKLCKTRDFLWGGKHFQKIRVEYAKFEPIMKKL